MRQTKLSRRSSALRWLAAFLALAAFVCAMGIYCITPEQALRKMARQNDLGELQVLEILDGQIFEDRYGGKYHKAYILQNRGSTCMAKTTYDWRYGWKSYLSFPYAMEHGEQPSVPVDFVWDEIEVEFKNSSSIVKQYVLGIILDPEVESVALNFEGFASSHMREQTKQVVLNRQDWNVGPHYNYFFYVSEPLKWGNSPKIRALDQGGNPITWTNLNGEQVEWYNSGWSDDFYEDWWNHLNGERD